jgi:hypothetical protein
MFCFIFRAVAGLNGFEFQDRLLKVDFANNRPHMICVCIVVGNPIIW